MTVALAAITPGVNFGWRVVPLGVSKQWVRLFVEPVGSFTSGRIFSALAREELIPMSKGQFINKGIVQG